MHFLECHLEIVCSGKLGNLNFHYKATRLVEILAFGVFFPFILTSASCPTFFPELGIAREFRKSYPVKSMAYSGKGVLYKTFGGP